MFKIALQENGYSVNAFINPIVAFEHLLNNPNKYELVKVIPIAVLKYESTV
ncbi:MAG TPA: hypothetical protein VIS28_01480 [Nitrososphaeraceae archaeon]